MNCIRLVFLFVSVVGTLAIGIILNNIIRAYGTRKKAKKIISGEVVVEKSELKSIIRLVNNLGDPMIQEDRDMIEELEKLRERGNVK